MRYHGNMTPALISCDPLFIDSIRINLAQVSYLTSIPNETYCLSV